MEILPPFRTLLRRLRKARDLSQNALAQQAFCALDTIKKIETGQRRPSQQLATQFADVLGLHDAERSDFLAAARAPMTVDKSRAAEMKSNTRNGGAGVPAHQSLPQQSTPFVGRVRELDLLLDLIMRPEARLITILAPGGMGKTRLALTAAEQLRQRGDFIDGVNFVSLAPVVDPISLDPAIADAFGLPIAAGGERSVRTQLLDYLSQKKLLLVLDNCEHVRDVIAELAQAILATSGAECRMLS